MRRQVEASQEVRARARTDTAPPFARSTALRCPSALSARARRKRRALLPRRRAAHRSPGTTSGGLLGFLLRLVRPLLAVARAVDLAFSRSLIAFSHGGDYTV